MILITRPSLCTLYYSLTRTRNSWKPETFGIPFHSKQPPQTWQLCHPPLPLPCRTLTHTHPANPTRTLTPIHLPHPFHLPAAFHRPQTPLSKPSSRKTSAPSPSRSPTTAPKPSARPTNSKNATSARSITSTSTASPLSSPTTPVSSVHPQRTWSISG